MRPLVGFAALGIFWGVWGAALPAVQRQAHADDGQLGLALVLVGVGALVSMRATGVLIDRLGARLTRLTVALFGVAGILPALAGSPAELYLFLLVVGGTSGAMDVAINADAVREELRTGRSLLNLAHASFSAAVVVASLGTGVLRGAGAGTGVVFGLAAAVIVLTALAMRPIAEWDRGAREARPKLLQSVPKWLLAIGFLGALAFWVEGSWQDWAALHLERGLEASPLVSSLGPALFAAAMAAGRLGVHWRARPGSERSVLIAGAAVAGAGSALAALAPWVALALVGITVAGAGVSVCAPTIVSIAGRAAAAHERATIVGSVTTLMYLGFLVGPAAVGGLAQLASLRASLAAVAGLAFLLSFLFAVVRLPR